MSQVSQEYLIKSESLTAIADEVRTLSGTTELMGLDDMATNVGEANTEIDNQVELLAQAVAALEGKASGSGVTLPTLDNPASASDILNGKEAIDSEGNVITGTITAKTASSLTASGATVTVPAGYYASQVTKSVATATQATPSVSVNNSGLITASATQTAGYVSAGTKSGTKQLTTQASKTITPSTSSQTAVASGVYTTGAVTVAGDANLVAENIAEGVSIFGVMGTHSGGVGNNNIVGEWTPFSSLPVTYGYDDDPVTYTTLYLEVPSNVVGYLFGVSNVTYNYTIASISHIFCSKDNSADFKVILLDGNSGGLSSSVVESGDDYKIYKIEILPDYLLSYYFLPIYKVQA